MTLALERIDVADLLAGGTRQAETDRRVARALEEAAKLLEPTAVRVSLPSATIRSEGELRAWLGEVETKVRAQLGQGPVIV